MPLQWTLSGLVSSSSRSLRLRTVGEITLTLICSVGSILEANWMSHKRIGGQLFFFTVPTVFSVKLRSMFKPRPSPVPLLGRVIVIRLYVSLCL